MRIFNKHYWWDLKYSLQCLFNPKQKWLTKEIPRTWCDKPELIKSLLFTCLQNYVEEEKGLRDEYDWTEDLLKKYVSEDYVAHVKKCDGALREAYNYITVERVELDKKYRDAFPPTRSFDEMFSPVDKRGCEELIFNQRKKDCYDKVLLVEAEIEKKDTEALLTIIKYRGHLWT